MSAKDGDPLVKKKTSMMYKAKKHMATKVGGAKLGQDVINRFLGDNGSLIVETLYAAAVKDVGEKRSKELLAWIYQLALKVKVLHDEKLLTPSDRRSLVKPINSLSIQLYQTLDQRTWNDLDEEESKTKSQGKDKDKDTQIDVTNLALKIAQFEAVVLQVLQRELHDRSCGKAKGVMGYFGGRPFLHKIINDVEFSELKGNFTACLFRIVHERLQQEDLLPAPIRCRTMGCCEEALVRSGKFAGSLYCDVCHAMQYKELVSSPSIAHFLVGNGITHRPLNKKIENGLPFNLPMLYKALWNFRQARPGLRRIFAEGVFDKYLSDKATHPVVCVERTTKDHLKTVLAQKITSEQKWQKVEVFASVETEMFAVTDPFFTKEIVGCPEYKQYLASRKPRKADRRNTMPSR